VQSYLNNRGFILFTTLKDKLTLSDPFERESRVNDKWTTIEKLTVAEDYKEYEKYHTITSIENSSAMKKIESQFELKIFP
jgi:hypothetical protein